MRDIGPDLRPNDYAKDNEANGEAKTTSSAQEKEPSVVEDLGQFYSLSQIGEFMDYYLICYSNGMGLVAVTLYGILLIYAYIVFEELFFGNRGVFFFVVIWKLEFIFYGKCLLSNLSFCL